MELSATTDGGLELRTTGWFIKSHPKIKPKKGIKKIKPKPRIPASMSHEAARRPRSAAPGFQSW